MINVVGALIWENGKFFICQRPKTKTRALLWEFVGGKVEKGETQKNALIRECKEELSADISVGELFLQVDYKYEDLEVNLSVYNASFLTKPVIKEHNDAKWITPSEIDNYEFCQADLPILDKIKSEFDYFDLDKYLLPLWDTKTVYYETGLFLEKTGRVKLLYSPDKIISVKDYGLNKTFVLDKDYRVENGYVVRTENSSIPYMEIEDYYSDESGQWSIEIAPEKIPYKFKNKKYAKYGETDSFTKFQFAVTYTHSDEWKGFIPPCKKDKLKNFYNLINKKSCATIGFLGDSITTGCNSSGVPQGGVVSPYAEDYPTMTVKAIQKRLYCKINAFNTAVGGWTSQNGVEEFEERVIKNNPDLLVLAFGMNDMGSPLSEYGARMEKMVVALHKHNPNAEIILVGTSVPNPETTWYLNQEKFVDELYKLEQKYPFAVVADMTKVHKYLFDAGKKYKDVSGNNINHPNDFVARLYAQTILKTILG